MPEASCGRSKRPLGNPLHACLRAKEEPVRAAPGQGDCPRGRVLQPAPPRLPLQVVLLPQPDRRLARRHRARLAVPGDISDEDGVPGQPAEQVRGSGCGAGGDGERGAAEPPSGLHRAEHQPVPERLPAELRGQDQQRVPAAQAAAERHAAALPQLPRQDGRACGLLRQAQEGHRDGGQRGSHGPAAQLHVLGRVHQCGHILRDRLRGRGALRVPDREHGRHRHVPPRPGQHAQARSQGLPGRDLQPHDVVQDHLCLPGAERGLRRALPGRGPGLAQGCATTTTTTTTTTVSLFLFASLT
mmetsp:Transcript_35666/g.76945  ORF Transcript_35666/g.76945 Transcript_35666/m.76945 type:complete len:300 (+) Transcript_35666:336-1235(+)